MLNKLSRLANFARWPNYVIFFVTARCNAACPMCFYQANMDKNAAKDELSVAEYEKIARQIEYINVLGISGGEPFLRRDLAEIIQVFYRNCRPFVVDLPTNAYLTDQIVKQAEEIVRSCPKLTVDIQLSIDGPEEVHNRIRGLKDGFRHLQNTYAELLKLRSRYKNLRVKACAVYSHFNQDHMEELLAVLEKDFSQLDRFVFSVAHGSVAQDKALELDWEKYFALCERLRQNARVKDWRDGHSLFTLALRFAKNDFLQEILHRKDMYRHCRAGRDVVAIGETGKVFPCEPLWREVGDLRTNGYDLRQVLDSPQMRDFLQQRDCQKCTCHWGLPMSNAIMLSPRYYPKMFLEMGRIMARSRRGEVSRGV